MRITRKLSALLALPLIVAMVGSALADPPAHAPAHGWRAKHVGPTGSEWELDYGVTAGRCDRKTVATVVGGVVGGVLANRIARDENRTVATLIGAAAGALIGNRIGDRLDDADQACFGHTLELASPGHAVTWTNETTDVRYQMTPGVVRQHNGSPCREFDLVAVQGTARSTSRGMACQSSRGAWEVVE